MRYAVSSRVLTIDQLYQEVLRLGASSVQIARHSRQIFCDLEPAAKDKLSEIPGVAVRTMGRVRHQQAAARPLLRYRVGHPTDTYEAQQPIYAGSLVGANSLWYQFRSLVDPPALGEPWTTAVLDTGIRETHRGLAGKVVHKANFTDSETPDDIFSHGTGVAFCLAGGRHYAGEESGIAPGMKLMNIKVLGDDGEGTDENVVLGIEHVIDLAEAALERGEDPSSPMYPDVMNMSFGTEDNDDPDHPIRLGIQAAMEMGIGSFVAAGNSGPGEGTILFPGSMPEVFTVGAATFVPWDVWQYSSRGPTLLGDIKPDLICYGVNIITAGAAHDDAFEMKSGTSFACPSFLGQATVLFEIALRTGFIEAEQAYGVMDPSIFVPIIGSVSRKPQGTPVEKDNNYGVGMPFGDLAAQMLGYSVGGVDVSQSLTALLEVGMVGAALGSLAKTM